MRLTPRETPARVGCARHRTGTRAHAAGCGGNAVGACAVGSAGGRPRRSGCRARRARCFGHRRSPGAARVRGDAQRARPPGAEPRARPAYLLRAGRRPRARPHRGGPRPREARGSGLSEGIAFFDGCPRALSSNWTDVGATGATLLTQTLSGRLGGPLYHWRARVLYAHLGVTRTSPCSTGSCPAPRPTSSTAARPTRDPERL